MPPRLAAALVAALALGLLLTGQSPVTAGPTTAGQGGAERVTSDGTRYVVEPAAKAPTTTPTSSARVLAAATPAPPYPLAQTFTLHSRPTSKHTIFLDFDGVTVAPGSWSVNAFGLAAGGYPGFKLDASAAFSSYEQTFIQQVWRRVANLYSPFDVDVTTEDGGIGDYTRTDATDDTWGVQVAITSSAAAAASTCGDCAGIAPVGTFDDVEASSGELLPAFVFSTYTFGSTSYINSASLTAMAAAHEAGHTFGLAHDATTANPRTYYPGHGNWYPVMGMSDGHSAIGQFSKGEYAGANNTQDDLAVIAAGGAPYVADDYASSSGSPTDLGTHPSFSVDGVISTDADNDYVQVNRGCAGPMIVKATSLGAGSSLDLKLTVYDGAGKVLGTSDPASGQLHTYPDPWWVPTGIDSTLTFRSVANAPYRIKVEGVGHGDPRTNGYSGYGSVGQYKLTVSSCSTPVPAPRPPGAPRIGAAVSGKAGGGASATARWLSPTSVGDAAITSYKVQAAKLNAKGKVVKTYTFAKLKAAYTSYTMGLPKGRYKFRVVALNRYGTGAWSAYSKVALSR